MAKAELVTLAKTFDAIRSDYDAMKMNQFRRRRTGLPSMGSGADYHYRNESQYLQLMESSRDLDRNDGIVGSITTRAVDQTLSMGEDGFIVDPKTPDPKVNEAIKARWIDWTEDADQTDIAQEHNFDELTRFAFRSQIVDGDASGLLCQDGCIQFHEGHRIRTPTNSSLNIVNGVRLDDRRRRLGYYITKDDINPLMPFRRVSDATFIPTRDEDGWRQFCHVYSPDRYTGTRGITAYARIFDYAAMHGDIEFAKLVQQQVVSCFAIFRERQFGTDPFTEIAPTGPIEQKQVGPNGEVQKIEGVGPGMHIIGNPGEKLQGFSPAVPNAEFFDHVKLIVTIIGINLGMPLCMAFMDGSETNFSGYRGAVDQARVGFRRNQRHLIKRWHKPIYWWKLRQWMLDDQALARAAVKYGNDFYRHKWTTPRWPYIEPWKDAQAHLLRKRNGMTSDRRLHAELGEDYEDIYPEIVDDRAKLIRKAKTVAKEINDEFDDGDPVGWRELAALPNADGIAMSLPAGEQPPEPAGSPNNKPKGGK